jgi:hypothetical protein
MVPTRGAKLCCIAAIGFVFAKYGYFRLLMKETQFVIAASKILLRFPHYTRLD